MDLNIDFFWFLDVFFVVCVCVTEAYGLLFSGGKWSKHIKAKCPKCYRFAPIYSCDFLLIFCGSSWLFSPHRCCTSFIRWRVLRYEHMIAELRGHGLMLDSDPRSVCSSWVAGSIEPHLQRKLELQGMWTMDILWQSNLRPIYWKILEVSKQRLDVASIGLCSSKCFRVFGSPSWQTFIHSLPFTGWPAQRQGLQGGFYKDKV